MASKSFGTKGPERPHLVEGKRGVAGEVDDLRSDIEEGFVTSEARTGYPVATSVDTSVLDLSDLSGADEDFVVTGTGFGTDSTKASATIGAVAAAVLVAGYTDTAMTVRLASGTNAVVTNGQSALLRITVDGVALFPFQLSVQT